MNAAASTSSARLTQLERILLIVPLLGGTVFGLLPFILGGGFGSILGYAGNDPFIYRLAGAATFGYAVALFMGIRAGDWLSVRPVVVATLVFNLGSLYACLLYAAGGGQNVVTYLILVTSILISAICAWLLFSHGSAPLGCRRGDRPLDLSRRLAQPVDSGDRVQGQVHHGVGHRLLPLARVPGRPAGRQHHGLPALLRGRAFSRGPRGP